MKTIKNLVFEGGGVKGVAYIGAMQELERLYILKDILRVGGTSAGAINACLFALKYSVQEQKEILSSLDFKKFEDMAYPIDLSQLTLKEKLFKSEWWVTLLGSGANIWLRKGLHSGDFFYKWVGDLIEKKTGKRDTTFKELYERTQIELHICAANVSTGYAEVFSHRDTPDFEVARAVRVSMSIPLFFSPVECAPNGKEKCTYVDGGVFRNYPIRLFDMVKFIEDPSKSEVSSEYSVQNSTITERQKFLCNPETLGFRLDSRQDIDVYQKGLKAKAQDLNNTVDYFKAVILALMNVQENQHLNDNDWERTIYIDTLGVGTVDFALTEEKKMELIESGRRSVQEYFSEFVDAEKLAGPEGDFVL